MPPGITLNPRAHRATVVLAAVVAIAFAATLLAVSPPGTAALVVALQVLFVSPGVLIVARTLAMGDGWLAAVTFGPAVGFGASSLALLAYWAAGGRGAWLLLAAPATAAMLAWPAGRLRGRWRLAPTADGDLRMLLLALLLVPVLVGRPFAMVGAETPAGHVYRKYFTADYVWVRAVVAELAKGDFLPANPYYVGDVLHYYWLPHLQSAVEYRAWPDSSLDALLLVRSVVGGAVFVAALYGLARLVVAVPSAALAGVACGFLTTSFEGVAALWVLWHQRAPLWLVRYLNIDAITRWNFDGMPIDGLQRILWYQPHHAAGYVLGLLGLVAVARRRRVRDPAVFAVAGALLAASTLISSFAGLMFTVIAAAYEAVLTLQRRAWMAAVFNAAYAALPLALGAAVVTLLDYVDHPRGQLSVIRLGINELATRHFWTVTPISFGPALLVGAAGAVVAWRRRVADVWPCVAVLPVAAWFYFYVDIRDHQQVYVGWRVGHLTFMALIPMMGLAFMGLRDLRRSPRWLGISALVLTLGLALPTVAIDVFSTQDIVPNGLGKAWNRIEVISPQEWDGLQWLRTRTAPDAVVQVDTAARRDEMWAYIPAFAERRMGAGVPLSMVPLFKYQEASVRVAWMYAVANPVSSYALAARVGINYIVVGPPERQAHPGVEARFDTVPDLLPIAFKNAALTIYAVRPAR